jgi:rubrerythrin
MSDRDNVIDGLKNTAGYFRHLQFVGYIGDQEIYYEHEKHCNDAIALLEEQEAVPVIQREIMHMLFWCCGSCGVVITDGDKFCRNCGKALKWEQ